MRHEENEEMTVEELAAQFGEPVPVPVVDPFPEENIYAVQARIRNLATAAVNKNLTPVGMQLSNCYTHVLVDLYQLANTMPVEQAMALKDRLRNHEKMVAEFISSVPGPTPPRRQIVPEPYIPDEQKGLVDAYMKHLQEQAVKETTRPFWDHEAPQPKLGFWKRLSKRLFG